MADTAEAAGYQAVARLAAYEGQSIWHKIQAFLTVNSILVTGMAAFGSRLSWPAQLAVCLTGLAMCLAWQIILARSWSMYSYWFAWGRNFERTAPALKAADINLFSAGRDFVDSGTPFKVEGESSPVTISKIGNLLPVRVCVFTVLWAFGAVYVVLFISFLWTRA